MTLCAGVFAFGVVGLGGCGDGRTQSTVEPSRTVDDSFQPAFDDSAFPSGEGPTVCIDEAHNNFHTMDGTYRPFADVLVADGYSVVRVGEPFVSGEARTCSVYVIADAQPPMESGDPPTFSSEEVEAIRRWVVEGGRLFLITDHAPDPEPIRGLAEALGFEVNDGYVLNGAPEGPERPILFQRSEGTLTSDPIVLGDDGEPELEVVATFTGSAFRLLEWFEVPVGSADRRDPEPTYGEFRPILVFGPGRMSWMPEEYWQFDDDTPRVDVSEWFQGGVREVGRGRVAFFSEAAMFTAQVFDEGRVRAGMNAPEAQGNLMLLRRVMRWLAGEESE